MQKPKGFKQIVIHPIKRRVAKYYLLFLRRFFGLKVIGITGSAGKTSTKEMLASILSLDGNTVKSRANIDPVYNIPTTILKCTPWTRYLVLEMGVEFRGEMKFYLWLATPDVGVITNIYPTHTEFFGDVEGVFAEKKQLVEGLSKNGVAILNAEDKHLRKLKNELKAKILWYGKGTETNAKEEKQSDVVSNFQMSLNGKKTNVGLPVLGEKFVSNALAAATVANYFGVSNVKIKKGLETFDVPDHRMRIIKHPSGAMILDDSYNNNPVAAEEALKAFGKISKGKERMVVMGDMLELGELEEQAHKDLGEKLARLDLSYLVGVGPASKVMIKTVKSKLKDKAVWARDYKEAYKMIEGKLSKNTALLVKGSRSIKLEKLIDKLS